MTNLVAVGLGITELPFATAAGYWRWVDLCEQGGVDSLWQTDRLVSREPILECMATMAALAGRTRRIKFGVNVVSLAMREPLLLAKQCATIDMLSEGRLLPGFGIGSPRGPEWAAMHLDSTTRGRVTDEALEILRLLWTQDRVDYDGRHFKLTNASISPRPVQAELPVWIGGASDAAIRRTARYGTGWQAGAETPEQLGRIVSAIRTAASAAGRQIDADHYGAAFAYHFGRPDDPGIPQAMAAFTKRTGQPAEDYFAIGDANTVLDRIAAYVAAGASKFILRPMARDEDGLMRGTRQLIEQILPEISRRWPRPRKG
jgi:probable F420-dependent oxidoreductase